mgnify:CR=1
MKEDLKIWAEAATKVIQAYWGDPEADSCPVCGIKPESIPKAIEQARQKGWDARGEVDLHLLP